MIKKSNREEIEIKVREDREYRHKIEIVLFTIVFKFGPNCTVQLG